MAFKSLTRTLFCGITLGVCLLSSSLFSMMQPGNQMPYDPKNDPFSPENIAQVAEEISKLTPEQQEQLYKESLDFLSKELNVSPEEVEKMIMDEFTQTGGTPMPEMPEKKEAASSTEDPAAKRQKIEEKEVPVKDLNDMANLLKNLADITDTIMRKASGLPDLPSRVDRWVDQKRLASWQAGVTWAKFKQQIELFVQKLGKLQNKDPRMNTYLYLPEMLSNVSLKNNLERLNRSLKRYNEAFETTILDIETLLDDPLAGAGSLSEESKNALLSILNLYGEALYTQNILATFDGIVQKFDPTAKKLRAEEEEKTKKALEAGKAGRTPTRIKEAGSKEDRYSGGSYYGEPSSGSYYPGSYYPGSSYGGYSGYPGSTSPSSLESEKPADSKGGATTEREKGGKASTSDDKKDDTSSERYKMVAHLAQETAKDIRTLGTAIAKELTPEKIDVLLKKETPINQAFIKNANYLIQALQEINNNMATISSLCKNFSQSTKGAIYAPIIASYELFKTPINAILVTLGKIIPEKLTAAQLLAYFSISAKDASSKNLGSNELDQQTIQMINDLLTMEFPGITQKKVAPTTTKKEALALIDKALNNLEVQKKAVYQSHLEEIPYAAKKRAATSLRKKIDAITVSVKASTPEKNASETATTQSETTDLKVLTESLTLLDKTIAGLPQTSTRKKN